ncbi:dimethylamine monooxygenase subunit DmmA family protein [Chelatococcus reniformis]|uniref:Uncharacterized protein n=1 Tax=Chelatococcus reniformis TaxID=1494448 RepID=A0A916UTH8_9HYPH|nr:dimethylamine monooxygenase subunit DmmA family protein [Chelatococcus reniformis]GGC87151.1 hypothetical protein GCM10010994_51350 [Chelatococcus reniformis]
MPETSIKSRPVYGTLAPQPGTRHILLADGDGAAAIVDLARAAPPEFFERAHIITAPAAGAMAVRAPLRALAPAVLDETDRLAAALSRLAEVLAGAGMGTRLYVAGTEGTIGQAMQVALDAGVELGAIATEHRGSRARRVQCAHCKTFIDEVTTQPVACSGCGLMLFVRDHYSRRLAAFQGVCVDAEEPGSAPTPEEVFT